MEGLTQFHAVEKLSCLAIGAHQDDIEIMAAHGIKSCFGDPSRWFAAITCTDGAGSARTGEYKDFSDQEMMDVRREEQIRAAELGEYAFVAQLGYPSSKIKGQTNDSLVSAIVEAIEKYQPDVVYTHNLADKHLTHVAVAVHVITGLRRAQYKVPRVLGCEVWRDLDWLSDDKKQVLDLTDFEDKTREMIQVFRSQTVGGKRYDLATLGRMKSHATFFESHDVDQMESAWFAMDMTPLVEDPQLSLRKYVAEMIAEFASSVDGELERQGEPAWK